MNLNFCARHTPPRVAFVGRYVVSMKRVIEEERRASFFVSAISVFGICQNKGQSKCHLFRSISKDCSKSCSMDMKETYQTNNDVTMLTFDVIKRS